jgi:lysophospholipase L1-like esterase
MHSPFRKLGRQYPVLMAAFGVQLLAGWLLSGTLLRRQNTLAENGRWTSTKPVLEKGVMGAYSFLSEHQTLAYNRLNLAAWHGFNEVAYIDPLDNLATIEFDAHLGKNGVLYLFYNRVDEQPYQAIRLSTVRRYPTASLTVDDEGRFLDERPLRPRAFRADSEFRVRLELKPDLVELFFDDQRFASFPLELRDRQRVGFRSHLNPVAVDNVDFEGADGWRITERFGPPRKRYTTPLIVTVVLLASGLLLLLSAALFPKSGRSIALASLTASLTFLVIVGLVLLLVRARASWYPSLDESLRKEEEYFRTGRAEEVLAGLDAQIGRAPGRRKHRLLFVGTSQTWGAGALHTDDTFVNRIEARLNQQFRKPRYMCANLGVSSGRARTMLPLLRTIQGRYRPGLVIINLGSNDRASGDFRRKIHEMVKLVRERNSLPVLVKEANSPLAVDEGLRARHLDMEALAELHEVPLIDLHGYLESEDRTGFLWWDKVHLTSYGHRLAAEHLLRELRPVMVPGLQDATSWNLSPRGEKAGTYLLSASSVKRLEPIS